VTSLDAGGLTMEPTITVSGLGRARGAPDALHVTVGVTVAGASVDAALSAANARAGAILERLRAGGVAERDVSTRAVAVEPQYRHSDRKPSRLVGYTCRNTVVAVLRDLPGAGALLAAAVEAGGDGVRVDRTTFVLEDRAALDEQARAAAFEDARAKAAHYAALADRQLGALVRLNEGGTPDPFVRMAAPAAASAGTETMSVPLAPAEQEIRVEVTATWALE
jgi:uncharacterized protein YggE